VYILDTDVVSNLRKKKTHPHLLSWIDEVGWQELATTVLTIMEVQIGIERARRSNLEVAESVEKWLAGLLQAGQPHVLPLNTDAALLLGRMNETPALRNFFVQGPTTNKPKTGADLAIASIAIAHGSVVVTGNCDDFLFIHRHFPLPGLFDPFQDKWLVKQQG
jgi:predicted nucleic acid-binding protein